MPLISALGRQRQMDFCEFEASLVYKVSARTARATQRETLTLNEKINNNKQTNKQKNQPSKT